MRTRPEHSTRPDDGLRKPENRLSSVVLPHPEGPTTATNSPREISRERSRNTSTAPKLTEPSSTRNGLSFISPSDTTNLREPHQYTIDYHADHADDDHSCDQQIHPQAVARVPNGESQTVASGDHLSRHYDQPGKTRRHPQGS